MYESQHNCIDIPPPWLEENLTCVTGVRHLTIMFKI